MNYIAAMDALEELESLHQTSGVMLNGKKAASDLNDQRLLIQSLLLYPPSDPSDERLQKLQHSQMLSWITKIKNCAQKQLCVRLPDGPIESFLPSLPSEFEQLSALMSCSDQWLRKQVQSVWNAHPDLSYYMIISNDIVFEAMLRGLFSAAQQCGIEKMSILLPLVSRCREVQQQNVFASQCASDYQILCDVGIEIATPRAIYFAAELAAYADVIVFHVDALCWLLYGKAKNKQTGNLSYHAFGFLETPFNEFDDIGISTLMGVAIQRIRQSNPNVRMCASGKYVLTEKGKQFCSELGIHSVIAPAQLFLSSGESGFC